MEWLKARLVDDISCSWRWLTTWLNVIGTVLLTYALDNAAVVNQLLPFLPGRFKPYAPLLGIVWGIFVQVARSWKQRQPNAAG